MVYTVSARQMGILGLNVLRNQQHKVEHFCLRKMKLFEYK